MAYHTWHCPCSLILETVESLDTEFGSTTRFVKDTEQVDRVHDIVHTRSLSDRVHAKLGSAHINRFQSKLGSHNGSDC